jgi:hypothetical protein
MFFSFEVCFLFWFSGFCCLCRFMWESGKAASNPPQLRGFFVIASGRAVKIP